MVEIRAAEAADAEAVGDVVRAAYGHYPAEIGVVPGPLTADYPAAIDAGAVWVAEVEGAIGAVLVLRAEAGNLLLENVAVRPELQRRGLGAALLDFAERHARAAGLAEVRLYTHERMAQNRRYYARRGYREVEVRDDEGMRRAHFVKSL